MGLGCANVVSSSNDFSFDVPVVRGHWIGKLSADGNDLAGTWSQSSTLPLNFTRQPVALTAKPISPPDPALAPVSAAALQSVLDKDLAESLKNGELAPATGAGVSIAVVDHGVRRVLSYLMGRRASIVCAGS